MIKTSETRYMDDGITTKPCGKIPTLTLSKVIVMTFQRKDFPAMLYVIP